MRLWAQPFCPEPFLVDVLRIEGPAGVLTSELTLPLAPSRGVERRLATTGQDGVREQVGAEPPEQVGAATKTPGATFCGQRANHRCFCNRVPQVKSVLTGADSGVVQSEPEGASAVERPCGLVPSERPIQRCFVFGEKLTPSWPQPRKQLRV